MSDLSFRVNRDALAQALNGNHAVIRAFERLVNDNIQAPSTVEEANALAGSALAVAQAAMASLVALTDALSRLESMPATVPKVEQDEVSPAVHVGTMGAQNHDAVEILGGTAALSTLSLSDQLTSTVATGKPPFVVVSTDRVTNLYADRAARADSLGSPSTYPPAATDLPTVIALANALRTAAINKGL